MDIKVKQRPTLSTLALAQAAKDAAFEIANHAVADLRAFPSMPRWTNTLANSIVAVRDVNGAKVLVTANYARWVHDGRKPGTLPNLDNLRDWALDNGITTESGLKALAFAIRRRGIKPRPFMRDYANSGQCRVMAQQVAERRLRDALA